MKPKKAVKKANSKHKACCDSSACCSEQLVEPVHTKIVHVKWRRLISKGRTCPRCGLTEEEIEKAVAVLRRALAPLLIKVKLEKKAISLSEFKKNPSISNEIWINHRSLEEWLDGKSGKSTCCDVCGPTQCRTLKVGRETYEAIPAQFVIKAGLLAASDLVVADDPLF